VKGERLMTLKSEALSCTLEVRRVLEELRNRGRPALADVAHRLGMTNRTLQRRLRAEGTTFRALLDEAALQVAEHALSGVSTLSETSAELGYSEPAAFHRAFKRWTGTTPRQFEPTSNQSIVDEASESAQRPSSSQAS
jgi:AraC-like DNA-binding protein